MSFTSQEFPPLQVDSTAIKIVSIAFGWLLGFAFLTVVKAGSQTWGIWRRLGHLTVYIIMLWLTIITCITFGLLCWLCMHGSIREGFTFFLIGTTLRCIIIQLTVQILTNRISILIRSVRLKRLLRWGPFIIVLVLNIGVYCVWIPAHLEVTGPFHTVNLCYSRCEEAIYMILDAVLNFYFCHLVKSRLIYVGIQKYQSLYRFNLWIILLSVSLDVLLIGMMSYPNPIVYVQFYPIIFMAKLNIEMSMADMIAKVARSGGPASNNQGRFLRRDAPSQKEFEPEDSNSARSSLRSQHAKPGATITHKTGNAVREWTSQCQPCQQHFDTRHSLHNNLYHAWVSGGTTHKTHLPDATAKSMQRNRSFDLESGFKRDPRNNLNVITKDTIVHVRTEDMRDGPVSVKRSVRG